jgi:hypothetical protein
VPRGQPTDAKMPGVGTAPQVPQTLPGSGARTLSQATTLHRSPLRARRRHQDLQHDKANQDEGKGDNEASVWPGPASDPLRVPALGAYPEGRAAVELIVVAGSVSNWVEVLYPLAVACIAPDPMTHASPHVGGCVSSGRPTKNDLGGARPLILSLKYDCSNSYFCMPFPC